MGRALRVDVGGMVYHVLNRANFRSRLFENNKQYQEFVNILKEAQEYTPMRILAYCLMPNHWHLVLYPNHDNDLARFMHRVTLTHTQRYHAKTKTVGYGHIYQGRYKSILVEQDEHFLTLVRYVERNAKQANLVDKAEHWKWSSLSVRVQGNEKQRKLLSPWPVPEPNHYIEWVNESGIKKESEDIQLAIRRNKPYGSEYWVEKVAKKFGLESTMRDPWRPQKGT